MTTKERMKLLTEWKEQFEKCDQAWTALEKIFRGLDCDSEIGKAIWGTFSRYTDSLAVEVGDADDWLVWYCYDNKFGERGFLAKAEAWKKAKKIYTLKDLCKLIEADLE